MQKMVKQDSNQIEQALPALQNARVGARLQEAETYSQFQIITTIPAGTVGKIQAAAIDLDPDLVFDFEILDVLVRTETTVASSTLQVKKGATAVSDAMISATANALTHALSIDIAQNKFFPRSGLAAYLANPCNLVDAAGATAPQRTVILVVRKL